MKLYFAHSLVFAILIQRITNDQNSCPVPKVETKFADLRFCITELQWNLLTLLLKSQLTFHTSQISLHEPHQCREIMKNNYKLNESPLALVFITNQLDKLVDTVFESTMNYLYNESLPNSNSILVFVLLQTSVKLNESEAILFEKFSTKFSKNFKQISLGSQIYLVFLENDSNDKWIIQSHIQFKLWELYYANSILQLQRISNEFDSTNFLNLPTNFASRRHFHGHELKVAGVERHTPSMKQIRINETSVIFLGGIFVDVMLDLRDALNFTPVGVYSSDYTQLTKDGNYLGIGRQVLNGEIDLCIALHTILPNRLKHFTFFQPLFPERAQAYFLQPSREVYANVFAFPFNTNVWLALAIFSSTYPFMLVLISKILFRNSSALFQRRTTISHSNRLTMEEIVVYTITIFCFQSVPQSKVVRSSWTMGLFVLCGVIFVMFLYIVYSACIVSCLAVERAPITSVAHLLNYGYTFLSSVAIQILFKGMPETPESLKVLMDAGKYDLDETQVFSKIFSRKSLYAYVQNVDSFYSTAKALNYTNAQLCQLSVMRFWKSKGVVAMFVRKGSPYKEYLSVKTILLIERGLRFRHGLTDLEGVPICPPKYEKVSGYEELQMSDVMLAFKIATSGFVIAVITLLAENWLNFCRNSENS